MSPAEKTIHAKHNPSLALGVDTSFPLALVQRESASQLNFGPPNNDVLVPFQDTSTAWLKCRRKTLTTIMSVKIC